MVDYKSSLTIKEQIQHPEWVGKYRELKQLVQETQQDAETGLNVECFL